MFDFGSGTLYISGPDGTIQPLGEVKEIEMETIRDDGLPDFAKLSEGFEATATFTAKISKEFMLFVTGAYDVILTNCPNKRVVHLTKYGKKKRTRKKNLHRAIKILEGMGD